MKDRKELQRVFGEADPGFVNAVHRSLETIQKEEEERHMKKFSLGLVIALACILLATVAIAAAHQWGVLNFIAERQGVQTLPEAQDLVQKDFAQADAQTDDAAFTVREAIFDGNNLYVVVAVNASNEDVLLMGLDSFPDDMAADLLGETKAGDLTLRDWAKENGKTKLVRISMHDDGAALGKPDFIDNIDFVMEDDGTLVYMLSGTYKGDAQAPTVYLNCASTVFGEDETLDLEKQQTAKISIALPAAQNAPDGAVQNTAPAVYSDCGVQVDRITLKPTPMAIYCEVEFTIIDEAAYAATDDGLWFEFIDENGERLPGGATSGSIGASEGSDGKRFIQQESLQPMAAMPEKIILRGYNCWDKSRYETHTFEMK